MFKYEKCQSCFCSLRHIFTILWHLLIVLEVYVDHFLAYKFQVL
jgi:hypothetical protein